MRDKYTAGNVFARLQRLEKRLPVPIMARCTNLENGEVKTAPLREFIDDFKLWRLEQVIDGNNAKDLDAYLSAFKQYIQAENHHEQNTNKIRTRKD